MFVLKNVILLLKLVSDCVLLFCCSFCFLRVFWKLKAFIEKQSGVGEQTLMQVTFQVLTVGSIKVTFQGCAV
jgi:ABC-type sulfate transport system permease component